MRYCVPMPRKAATRYKFQQVLFITVAWILIGILLEVLFAIDHEPGTNQYGFIFAFGNNALEHLLITALGPLIGGLAGGSFIVFYQRERLRGKTYGQKLLIHSAIYILFVAFCTLAVGLIGAWSNRDAGFWDSLYRDIFGLRVLRLIVTWYVVVIATIFFLDVSEKYGAGVLKKQLLGHYHVPVQEERVFLFLDLKSSTTIAEEIGSDRYFRMLRFFYGLANEAILRYDGEIYQYVGDEVVISWPKEKGREEAACLRCFFAIQEQVTRHAPEFMEKYGTVPQFKGASHQGIVTAGEVGIMKKDLVYSGDVLNTSARIMALCNTYGATLIVSEQLKDSLSGQHPFRFTYLDEPVLRGKTSRVKIFAVEMKETGALANP